MSQGQTSPAGYERGMLIERLAIARWMRGEADEWAQRAEAYPKGTVAAATCQTLRQYADKIEAAEHRG